MSSDERGSGRNALYVNIAPCQSSIYDATGAKAAWVAPMGEIAVGAIFRDMGKTLYLPAATTTEQSTILRKVQFVPQGGVSKEFLTGYISLGGQTYAGGSAADTVVFARAF